MPLLSQRIAFLCAAYGTRGAVAYISITPPSISLGPHGRPTMKSPSIYEFSCSCRCDPLPKVHLRCHKLHRSCRPSTLHKQACTGPLQTPVPYGTCSGQGDKWHIWRSAFSCGFAWTGNALWATASNNAYSTGGHLLEWLCWPFPYVFSHFSSNFLDTCHIACTCLLLPSCI